MQWTATYMCKFFCYILGCRNNCSSWGLCHWLENWYALCIHDFWRLCWIHNGGQCL